VRQTTYFPLKGGINLVDPPLTLQPGELLGSSNYEHYQGGGYRRIDGYERFDGYDKPSEAVYYLVNFDAGTTAILAGDVISNVASPTAVDETGEVLADAVVTAGSFGTNDAVGYFYVTTAQGYAAPAFADNDTLYVSAASVATGDGAASEGGATTDADDTTYSRLAIDVLRARISTVPGSGDIRGVWMYNGVVYAFRDDAGVTTCVMFASSITGWSEVDLGATIAFTAGSDAGDVGFTVGETVTGGTSLATAVVVDISAITGTWAGNNAAGTLYLKTVSGTFQAETITGGTSGTTATIAGDVTVTTLTPGGRYEFITENFFGQSGSRSMYGVDGANFCFRFNSDGFRQIPTGMPVDTPTHLIAHKKHLFLSFGSSVQHSGIGTPTIFSIVAGAAEIATGDDVVGFATIPGDALAILDRNSTYILYGTSVANWNLATLSDEAGAIEWSIQRLGVPIYLDDRGLTDLRSVQDYGDFKGKTFSKKIKPIIDAAKSLVLSSTRVRDKDQYRLFLTDKSFLIAAFEDGKFAGFTECEYPVEVSTVCSCEDTNGTEVLFFGSTDGYVYQMDKGTSFDGVAVTAFIRPAFNYLKTPEQKKRFFKAILEVTAASPVTINFTPDYDYGDKEGLTQFLAASSSSGYWNIGNWNEFNWGEQSVSNPEAHLSGSGVNISMVLYSEGIYDTPHIIHGVLLHYSKRGLAR